MIIRIKGQNVTLEDGKGQAVCMSTSELIEIVRILNLSITSEGDFRFNCLEFTV